MEIGIPPSEFPQLTPTQFFGILSDPESKKPKSLSHQTILEYTREYQKKHFGRTVEK